MIMAIPKNVKKPTAYLVGKNKIKVVMPEKKDPGKKVILNPAHQKKKK